MKDRNDLVDSTLSEFRMVDILVNNAGLQEAQPWWNVAGDEKAWGRQSIALERILAHRDK